MSASHPKITFKVFERTLPESLDNATFNMMLPVKIVLRRGDPAWNRTPEVRPAVRPAASEPEGGRPKRPRVEPGVWSLPYEQNPPAELVGRLMQALPIVVEDSLPTGPSAAGASSGSMQREGVSSGSMQREPHPVREGGSSGSMQRDPADLDCSGSRQPDHDQECSY